METTLGAEWATLCKQKFYFTLLTLNTSASPAKKSPVQPIHTVNETPLESCNTEKDLGVWVSSNLTSHKQVTEQCAKANKLLRFVR